MDLPPQYPNEPENEKAGSPIPPKINQAIANIEAKQEEPRNGHENTSPTQTTDQQNGPTRSDGGSEHTELPSYPKMNPLGWLLFAVALLFLLINGMVTTSHGKKDALNQTGIESSLKTTLDGDPTVSFPTTKLLLVKWAGAASKPSEAKLKAGLLLLAGEKVDPHTLGVLLHGNASDKSAYNLIENRKASFRQKVLWAKEVHPRSTAEAEIIRHSMTSAQLKNPQVASLIQPFFTNTSRPLLLVLEGFASIGLFLGLAGMAYFVVVPKIMGHPVRVPGEITVRDLGVRFFYLVLAFVGASVLISPFLHPIGKAIHSTAESQLILTGVAEALIVAFTLLIIRTPFHAQSAAQLYGLTWSDFKRTAGFGILGYPIALLGVVTFGLAMRAFQTGPGVEHPLLKDIGSQSVNGSITIIVLITVSILAPIYEEIVFRGTLMPIADWMLRRSVMGSWVVRGLYLTLILFLAIGTAGLSIKSAVLFAILFLFGYFVFIGTEMKTLSPMRAMIGSIVISSLIFGAIHPTGPTTWLMLGSIGAVNGYLVYRCRSLWPALVVHGLYNLGSTIFAILLSRSG